jgi:predicted DNA-binding ribbon-helix-helix protein
MMIRREITAFKIRANSQIEGNQKSLKFKSVFWSSLSLIEAQNLRLVSLYERENCEENDKEKDVVCVHVQ